MIHYIAMGGEHGCMPDNCSAYGNFEDAINGLNEIYELEQWQLDNLREFASGYSCTELNREQGGAYCEISSCDCLEPWEHSEFDSPDNWPEYCEEEPEEGDYIIEHTAFGPDIIYKYNESWKHEIRENDKIYDIITTEMDREGFWPNVWTLSDHGNLQLVNIADYKKEE